MCLHVEQLTYISGPNNTTPAPTPPHPTLHSALDDELPCPRDTNEANDSISDSRTANASVNSCCYGDS